MVFAKQLREGIKRGRIRLTIRVWLFPRVKVGGRYKMDDGHVVVDSIEKIRQKDITRDLARESGFDSVAQLMQIAKHGKGENIYLIRFHYLRAGQWDTPRPPASSR
jgi:hypothetical protein